MSWEAYDRALNPQLAATSPSPPSVEEQAPASSRDELLAAFLADGPLAADSDAPSPEPSKGDGKITIKRDR